MFKHLMKLIWNRKGNHGLIIAEIVIAFLVVFGIGAVAWHNYHLYQQPLGFEYEGALHVTIRNGGDWTEQDGQTLEQAIDVVNDMPNVESAFAMLFGPFRGWRSNSNYEVNGVSVLSTQNYITDGGHEAFGMQLLEGRWTGPEDIGAAWEAAVIDRSLAEKLFPGKSPIGEDVRPPDEENPELKPVRVVGVFEAFRQMGEFSEIRQYVMKRLPLEEHKQRAFTMMIYPREGAPLSLQEDILRNLQRIAPSWTLRIDEVEKMRQARLDQVTTPLSIMALVGAFLILMVGFGLFGVLWQSVTRRTGELGLRRAMGANRRRIYRQIVSEMLLVAGIALLVGLLIAIQFPLLGTFELIDWRAAIGGIVISGGIVLALCLLCALYPGWLASRRSPAEALHYE